MRRAAHRLALAMAGTVAMAGLTAGPSLAATTTTAETGPATHVTAKTATLNATINTGGVAGVYQFQWGTDKNHLTHGTPIEAIKAGSGTEEVHAELKRLKPFTTYHYRIVVTTGTSKNYTETTYGRTREFTTHGTGRLLLESKSIPVSAKTGRLDITFRCDSSLPCRGKFSLTTRARIKHTKRFATVVLTDSRDTFYDIKPHEAMTLHVLVKKSALTLLEHAKDHRVRGKVTANPAATGQHGVVKMLPVFLTQ